MNEYLFNIHNGHRKAELGGLWLDWNFLAETVGVPFPYVLYMECLKSCIPLSLVSMLARSDPGRQLMRMFMNSPNPNLA